MSSSKIVEPRSIGNGCYVCGLKRRERHREQKTCDNEISELQTHVVVTSSENGGIYKRWVGIPADLMFLREDRVGYYDVTPLVPAVADHEAQI